MSLVLYIALKRTKLHFSLKRELFVLTNLYIAVSMTFSFLTFSKFIGAREWRAGQDEILPVLYRNSELENCTRLCAECSIICALLSPFFLSDVRLSVFVTVKTCQ